MKNDDIILRTIDLKKYFEVSKGSIFRRAERKYVRAVDGVSLSIREGETLGVVGESGCGKTTFARTITLLTPPTGGEIHFSGTRIDNRKANYREIYRNVQMVFQDPESSLDPHMEVKDLVGEGLGGLMGYSDAEITAAVNESLVSVGLSSDFRERNAQHLSGGQKQRVAIARAISIHPKLVILDEPTSALDVSVQAQILELLIGLQKKFNLSYLLITHNIAVAKYLTDRVAVMYAGKVVEEGPTVKIIDKPRHPYTISLVKSAPIPDPWRRNLLNLEIRGEVPSAINPPGGCRFNPRCPYAEQVCSNEVPPLREITPSQLVACHFAEKTEEM